MKLNNKKEINKNLKEKNLKQLNIDSYFIAKEINNTFMKVIYFNIDPGHYIFGINPLQLIECYNCPKYIDTLDKNDEYYDLYMERSHRCEKPKDCELFKRISDEVETCLIKNYEEYKFIQSLNPLGL